MYQTPPPSKAELPSSATLLKSTIIAALVAAVVLFVVVLPAEYGIDVTGMGKVLGLTRMGEIKKSLAEEAATEEKEHTLGLNSASSDSLQTTASSANAGLIESSADTSAPPSLPAVQSDERSLTLAPDEGKEIKLTMKQGDSVNYTWMTSGGKVNFDAHADSKALKIDYHSYEKGSDSSRSGTLTAAFDGGHGWFWRNRTDDSLVVTLRVDGQFSEVKVYE